MRSYWKVSTVLKERGYSAKEVEVRTPAPIASADLVSSHVAGTKDMHAPCLDIDYAAELLPSSTQGHYHLFLNRQMPWRRYKKLLKALRKADIIEEGYYKMSMKRRGTFLRVPEVLKTSSSRTPDEVAESRDRLLQIEEDLEGIPLTETFEEVPAPAPEPRRAPVMTSYWDGSYSS